MTEEQKVQTEPAKVKSKNVVCIGTDIGTMNLVCARSDSDQTKMTRNVFLSVDKDLINLSQLSKISYVEGEDGQIFIIGTDAFEFANLFGKEVSRPMAKGLISPKEIAAIDVLSLMIKDLIGDIKDKDVYCSYSIPAESIDEGRSVTYHENVFARILNTLGINYKSVNEAMAIIYSECAAENFSGIAISFGAGMANCLSGETEIPLLDGTVKTMKDLAENYKDQKFWVYSCKEDGSIVPGLAHSPRKTGIKPIIRIHLDNNTYFDCTEDHPIMMRDGRYIKAGEIKNDDSLMPLYLEESKWNEMPGYLSCYNNKHKHWEMVHNMVMREHHNIYRKKGYITHHKNFNKKDNSPENLDSVIKSDHLKFHREVSVMGGKIGGRKVGEKRKGKTCEEIFGKEHALEIRQKIRDGVLNSTSAATNRKRLCGNTYAGIYGLEKAEKIKKRQSVKKKGLKYEQIMSDQGTIDKRKKECKEQCVDIKPWLYRKEIINSGTWKSGHTTWNKGLSGDEYKNYFKNGFKNQYSDDQPVNHNHKVTGIENLNICAEVYDLTVENYHNFAIQNGVFVHNCALSYKGIEAHKFSTARAGDWIDQRVAESLAMIPNRVTNIKEKYMKFSGEVEIKNKKTQRVLEALFYYHKELIEYTVKKIIKEFEQKVDIEVGDKLPIVISGGTSMPGGFDNMFKSILANYELPFEISEVRKAKNPLTAVANGLLVKTMADVQTMRK